MKRRLFTLSVVVVTAALMTPAGGAAQQNEGRRGGDPVRTGELIATLESANTQIFEKARACQQLAIIGTAGAVPVLASFLGDERLAHYAREALEAMAEPAADAALRDALAKVSGEQLVGVVNSLGMRADVRAGSRLAALAADERSSAAPAALLALARIGTPEAADALRRVVLKGPDRLRAAAGEAALLLAERRLAAGDARAAAELYDAVRSAPGSEQLKLSSLRGALLAKPTPAAMALLSETLRATDAAVRDVGLRAIRDLAGEDVTVALLKELPVFSAQVQAGVIMALVERGDERALPAIEQFATGRDVGVRVAALRALGRMGHASSVTLLLGALRAGTVEEREAAQRSLAQIRAAQAEPLILRALETAEQATKISLIAILGERSSAQAAPAVLRLARETDAAVRRAALRALVSLARPGDLPELIAVAATLTDDETRTLADRAIYAASMKILEPEKRAEPVIRALRDAKEPATRAAMLRPLGAVVRGMGGNAAARATVSGLIRDGDADVRLAAVRCLADWPDATPVMELLAVAAESVSAAERALAFDGVTRMVSDVGSGKDKTPVDALAVISRLNAAVKSDDQRMKVVAALGSVKRVEALRMLVPYLEVPAVKTEAALAVVQIAPALLAGKDAAEVKATLQRIAESETDPDVKAKAARLVRGPAPTPKGAKKGKKG